MNIWNELKTTLLLQCLQFVINICILHYICELSYHFIWDKIKSNEKSNLIHLDWWNFYFILNNIWFKSLSFLGKPADVTARKFSGHWSDSKGNDQNTGAISLNQTYATAEDCLRACRNSWTYKEKTGCEYYAAGKSCRVHTAEVTSGCGSPAYTSYVLGMYICLVRLREGRKCLKTTKSNSYSHSPMGKKGPITPCQE